MVWRLDLPGRSLRRSIEFLHDLAGRSIQFGLLSEVIVSLTPTGWVTFHVISALVECQRVLIDTPTNARLKEGKAWIVRFGCKASIIVAQARHARYLIDSGRNLIGVALSFGIGRTLCYRHLTITSAGGC